MHGLKEANKADNKMSIFLKTAGKTGNNF